MISPLVLIVAGASTAIVCVYAWWRYRGDFAPIPSEMFLVMAGGVASIALFYIGILAGSDSLAAISRWIWLTIIGSTLFMAITVLCLKKREDKNGRG